MLHTPNTASNSKTRAAAHAADFYLTTLLDAGDLSDCANEPLAVLQRIGTLKTFMKDDVIFHEGEANNNVYYVLSGVIRTSQILADGRRLVAKFIYPGELLDYDSARLSPYTAEAISPLSVLSISKKLLERQLDTTPILRDYLMETLLKELQEAQSQVLALGRLTAIERVTYFLNVVSEKLGSDKDGAVQLPMSRMDIADHLGLTIETVSRVISRLKREGQISLLPQNRFVIKDSDDFAEDFWALEM